MFWNISGTCADTNPENFWKCPGNFRNISGTCPGNVQEFSGGVEVCLGSEISIFPLLIRGAINAVLGDVLGGSGEGFGGCFGSFGGGFWT